MRKFIIRLSIFIGIIILILAFNFIFNSIQLSKEVSLNNTETLIIGDSRMMTGVNPEKINNSMNVAQNSESYIITYYKLKYLLTNNRNIKRILLGFSYPSFSGYMDRIFKNDIATADIFDRIYPIMNVNDFNGYSIDKKKYYQVYLKNILVYPHLNHSKYLGGFVKLKSGIESANINTTIQRHYYDKDSNNVGVSFIAPLYLDSIYQLTQKNNIDLVLVNLPLHIDYLNRVPNNFINYFNFIKSKCLHKNVTILDYGKLSFENKYFKDYNHLSEDGANEITEKIKNDLKIK